MPGTEIRSLCSLTLFFPGGIGWRGPAAPCGAVAVGRPALMIGALALSCAGWIWLDVSAWWFCFALVSGGVTVLATWQTRQTRGVLDLALYQKNLSFGLADPDLLLADIRGHRAAADENVKDD